MRVLVGSVRHHSYGQGTRWMLGDLGTKPDWTPLGYEPTPGTLSVVLRRKDWEWVTSQPGLRIVDGVEEREHVDHLTDQWIPASIGNVACHVRAYRFKPRIEIVSAVHLRTRFNLADGDPIQITV